MARERKNARHQRQGETLKNAPFEHISHLCYHISLYSTILRTDNRMSFNGNCIGRALKRTLKTILQNMSFLRAWIEDTASSKLMHSATS